MTISSSFEGKKYEIIESYKLCKTLNTTQPAIKSASGHLLSKQPHSLGHIAACSVVLAEPPLSSHCTSSRGGLSEPQTTRDLVQLLSKVTLQTLKVTKGCCENRL